MKRYKLLKDLAGLKAGSILYLNELGNLVASDKTTIVFLANFIHHYSLLDSGWFEEIQEYKRWRAKRNDFYYWLTEDLEAVEETEDGGAVDEKLHVIGNYFKTEGEAQKAAEWLKAFTILRDDTKGFKPNWENCGKEKWVVEYYPYDDVQLAPYAYCFTQNSVIYFATQDDAEESIKTHEREWKIYYGVEE